MQVLILSLLGCLLQYAQADMSLNYPLPGFEHTIANRTATFAKHSMLGMLLFNDQSTRYAEEVRASEPAFCSNFSLTSQSILLGFLQYSGKSPNDLGLYEDCRYLSENAFLANYSSPQYSVFTLSFMGGLFKWGVCYPSVCHRTMNTTVYQSVSLLGIGVKHEMIDTFEPVTQTRWESILMITIFALLILVSLVGTFIHHSSIGQKDHSITAHQSSELQPLPTNSSPLSYKEGLPKFLTCFSLSFNLPRLLTRQRPYSPTDVLDGIRVLSISWVVLGHSYFFPIIISSNNLANIYLQYSQQFFFSMVTQAVLSVDTFFFLSAFLATYLLLTKLPSQPICPLKSVPLLYLRRFYRLTPLLAFIMYFSAFVIYPLTSGPMRNGIYNNNIEHCKQYGWSTLLYLINYYPQSINQSCFAWTWYLSIDMHLFLFLPFYVILYKASSLAGYIALALSLVANIIANFSVAYSYKLGIGIIQPPDVDYLKVFYTRFYLRAGAYLVGIIFAVFYFNYTNEVKERKLQMESEGVIPQNRPHKPNFAYALFIKTRVSSTLAYSLFIGGFLLTFFCVFLVYWPQKAQDAAYWPLWFQSLFNAIERPLFVTGVSLVLIPLLSGRFTLISSFLGHQVFAVLSRFTYSVYLIHVALLYTFVNSEKATVYFTHFEALVITFSILMLSYILGGVMTLLVESPLSNIDKHFLFKEEPRKK